MKLSQIFVLMCALMELACLMSGTTLADNPEGLDLFVNTVLPISLMIVIVELIPNLIKKTIREPKARMIAVSTCIFVGVMVFSTLIGEREITDSFTMTAIYLACIVAVFLISKAIKWFIMTRSAKTISEDSGENNDSGN